MNGPPLSQIAFSVTDLPRTHGWYREVLGFAPAGGTKSFRGPIAERVQGLPRAASVCWWMVDRQDHFQLEIFQFARPPVRPLPEDWRPCDIGYTTVGVHVADFDEALNRLEARGVSPLAAPEGPAGARRACVHDPEGVLLELMEDDPRGPQPRDRPRAQLPVATRFVTLSVPDLEASRKVFVDALGLAEATGVELHDAAHEELWGLAGAERRSLLLWAGDLLVEIVQYTDPVGKPWPEGYRVSDQGILNVAFGFRDKERFDAVYERCRKAGMRGNWRVLNVGGCAVVYMNDPQGFSFELLFVQPRYERYVGFRPRSAPGRQPKSIAGIRTRSDPAASNVPFRRALVTGATGGLGRALCRLLAADGCSLVLLDRDAAALERLRGELAGAYRADVETSVVDLLDPEALESTLHAIVAEGPAIDLVVSNAGIDRPDRIDAYDWRLARDHLTVNTVPTYLLVDAFVPHILEHGGGHFAVTASIAAIAPTPYESAYTASKAALANFVDATRAELAGRGVTFTTAYLGFMETPMLHGNAFRARSGVAPRAAAERIYAACVARRSTVWFPRSTAIKARVLGLLPTPLRDRLARAQMRPDFQGRHEFRRAIEANIDAQDDDVGPAAARLLAEDGLE